MKTFPFLLGCIFAFPGIWKGWIEGVIVGLLLGTIIGIVFGSIGSLIPSDLNQVIRRGIYGNAKNRFGNIISVVVGYVIEYSIWGILLGIFSVCIYMNVTIFFVFNSLKENNHPIYEIIKEVVSLMKHFWLGTDIKIFLLVFLIIGLVILIFVKIIANSYKKFRERNPHSSK